MTFNLETDIVASRFDPVSQTCSYTIERDGNRYTAHVPLDDLSKHKGNKMMRRTHIANALMSAMRGKPDNG